MNKIKIAAKWFHKAVIYYLIGYAPVFALYAILGPYLPENSSLHTLNGLSFIWIQSVAYFFLALVFYREFRESLMTRIAGFKESDEREELATAKAARHTFLLMLAVQAVFLVLSLTTFHLERDPESKSGKGMIISLGMGLESKKHLDFSSSALAEPAKENLQDIVSKRWLVPPNFFGLLAILLGLQIAGFRLFSWRAYKGS